MPKHASFNIPKVPMSLNIYTRIHWSQRAKQQETWDYYILAAWNNSGRLMFFNPVRLRYTISFPQTRLRDLDNYIGGTKLITDALKRTFFRRDDALWLQKIEVEFKAGTPGTFVLIEELENNGLRQPPIPPKVRYWREGEYPPKPVFLTEEKEL